MISLFPASLNYEDFLAKSGISAGDETEAEAREIYDAVARVGRPKSAYRIFDTVSDDGGAFIGGRRFDSRVLGRNLRGVKRVVAFVCTCGTEVDEADLVKGDSLREWWVDVLKTQLLLNARVDLLHETDRLIEGETFAVMSPGSGDRDIWPIEQQRELFGLFEGEEREIGVELLPTCLMTPNKTVSGIRYNSAHGFKTCQVCHRENCPNRRATFDAAVYEAAHG